MSAIAATFVDMRPIGTRKVCRLVFEVPAEQADTALEILGYPRPDDPVWVGIARLVKPPTAGAAVPSVSGGTEQPAQAPAAPKRTASQRAALLCKRPEFWKWFNVRDEAHAAEMMRRECGVASRSEIDINTQALYLFSDIEGRFRARNDPPVVPEGER